MSVCQLRACSGSLQPWLILPYDFQCTLCFNVHLTRDLSPSERCTILQEGVPLTSLCAAWEVQASALPFGCKKRIRPRSGRAGLALQLSLLVPGMGSPQPSFAPSPCYGTAGAANPIAGWLIPNWFELRGGDLWGASCPTPPPTRCLSLPHACPCSFAIYWSKSPPDPTRM